MSRATMIKVILLSWCSTLLVCLLTVKGLAAQKDTWSIAVISNVDPELEKLCRDWVGGNDSIDIILQPKSLRHLAMQIQALTGNRKIKEIYFMGHASKDEITFIQKDDGSGDQTINASSFRALKKRFPNLSKSFAPKARAIMINCYIGQNKDFANALGDALFSANGGSVLACTRKVHYGKGKDDQGHDIMESIELPSDKLNKYVFRSRWKTFDIPDQKTRKAASGNSGKRPSNFRSKNPFSKTDGFGKGFNDNRNPIVKIKGSDFFKN